MKNKWVAACLALTACGGGSSQPEKQSSDPLTSPKTTVVVFIGDSITASWQLPDYVNVGISGQTTPQMLARFQHDVLDVHPAVVVIGGGTNDVKYIDVPNTDSVQRMAELAAASGACVIIGDLPPIADWTLNTGFDQAQGDARVAAFNNELRTMASAYGYRFADYHSVLINADGSQDSSLFTDLLHPNVQGHEKMFEVVHPLISQCLG